LHVRGLLELFVVVNAEDRTRGRARKNGGHAAGRYRHASDMADRAGGLLARRVGVPKRGADGHGQDGHEESRNGCHLKPSKVSLTSNHFA
jgi:hypothetical protein